MQPPISAQFRRSLVLTYAAPADQLAPLLPSYLGLDTFTAAADGLDRGFVAVAMVQTERLRPGFLPKWLGRDFFLIGYRVFARYSDLRGRRLRGLYILRSATDSRLMASLGSRLTTYDYRHCDVHIHEPREDSAMLTIDSRTEGLSVAVDFGLPEPLPPPGSPFCDWRTARRFAGPLPFTFGYDARRRAVSIVEGVRTNWRPRPVAVQEARVAALAQLVPGADLTLASAFEVTEVPYRWRAAYYEPWPR